MDKIKRIILESINKVLLESFNSKKLLKMAKEHGGINDDDSEAVNISYMTDDDVDNVVYRSYDEFDKYRKKGQEGIAFNDGCVVGADIDNASVLAFKEHTGNDSYERFRR